MLEDQFISEARRQGGHPTTEAMKQFAVRYAGLPVADGYIVTPAGSIHLRDAVASMRSESPSLFVDRADTSDELPAGATITQQMQHELRNHSRALPSDWQAVRSRVTGKTRQMMDEAEAARMIR